MKMSDKFRLVSVLLGVALTAQCYLMAQPKGTPTRNNWAGADLVDAIMLLSGAESIEDLDEQEVERYERMHRHPLNINKAKPSDLSSSGLFSRYQIASISDYRERHGDILSFSELATLDGFGSRIAEALSCFIKLDSDSPPGSVVRHDSSSNIESLARLCAKSEADEPADYNYGAKFRIFDEKTYSFGLAVRRYYGSESVGPDMISGSLYFKAGKVETILGNFYARFGQGLVCRSGFSLAGLGSVRSFSRNPTGLSPSWSYTSPARGLAMHFDLRNTTISAACLMDNSSKVITSPYPLVNITGFYKMGQWGTTITRDALSVDTRFCVGKMDLFGEFAFDMAHGVSAGVAGLVYNPAYQRRLALMMRYYPALYDVPMANAAGASARSSDEEGVSLGYESESFGCTFDAVMRPSSGSWQYRTVLQYSTPDERALMWSVRLIERIRPRDNLEYRTDLRMQLDYNSGRWQQSLRLNALKCRDLGLLGYYELGLKFGENSPRHLYGSAFGRLVVFKVGNWDDRIYVYERDAPGNFSSRAFYGRGVNFQFYTGISYRKSNWKRYSAYLRFMIHDCSRLVAHDNYAADIRLQTVMEF